MRVLYSFPHRIGAGRICYTAWEQVRGAAAAGAKVVVAAGAVARPLPSGVRVEPTLARGRLRLPYRAVGVRRASALHDTIVARRLPGLADRVDVVHVWPTAARRTIAVANRLGIPTVLERPNAHTAFAYEAVRRESERIGVTLPPGAEHAFDAAVLAVEEEEYASATRLLCPSEFVERTFLDRGFPPDRLVRHHYGYDENRFSIEPGRRRAGPGLVVLFAGFCAVRKGLHLGLEAWLRSPAHRDGTFLVAGGFLPAYREKLAPMLAEPSVQVLGHRDDVPELLRRSDVMVLPSVEEGFGLVCVEAMASGAVPLVSEACTDLCRHLENALVHPVGDVAALASHFAMLRDDPSLLARLRAEGLRRSPAYTWRTAGERLVEVYRETVAVGRLGAGPPV